MVAMSTEQYVCPRPVAPSFARCCSGWTQLQWLCEWLLPGPPPRRTDEETASFRPSSDTMPGQWRHLMEDCPVSLLFSKKHGFKLPLPRLVDLVEIFLANFWHHNWSPESSWSHPITHALERFKRHMKFTLQFSLQDIPVFRPTLGAEIIPMTNQQCLVPAMSQFNPMDSNYFFQLAPRTYRHLLSKEHPTIIDFADAKFVTFVLGPDGM